MPKYKVTAHRRVYEFISALRDENVKKTIDDALTKNPTTNSSTTTTKPQQQPYTHQTFNQPCLALNPQNAHDNQPL